MAIIKDSILGDVKGKLGSLVIRKVKGKSVVTVRPLKYKKTKSKKAKNIRGRFSIAVEFSKYINSVPILKEVWSGSDIKSSSAFNLIEKFNINHVNDDAPSLQNTITPPFQINKNFCNFPFEDISFNSKEIICTIKDKEVNYPASGVDNCTLVIVILFFEPKEKSKKFFSLDNIICPGYNPSLSEEFFKIKISPVIKKKISFYNKSIIYAASIIPAAGKIKYCSSLTFSKQFNLN